VLKRGGFTMKRIATIALVLVMAVAVAGCGLQAGRDYKPQAEAPQPLYKDLDHVGFSWFGYKKVTAQDAKQSSEENWWGSPIPYIPAG
jgi:predicted small secreted protein